MKMLLTKIIHKLLKFKRKLKINKGKDKYALVSYVLYPPAPFDFKFFFNVSHNRFLTCYLMVNVLKSKGYTIHVYDYLDFNIDYNLKYDFFLGHNKSFSQIGSKLNKDCKKILLTTGSSPFYDNERLTNRQKDLQIILNTQDVFFKPFTELEYVNKNVELADAFFMIGNGKISDTWKISKDKKIQHFSNVNLLEFKKKEKRSGNFIYLSSVGQLRRGLDLVLEGFKGRKEKVYICGDYSEPAFLKHFDELLFNSSNIIPMGFVDQTSDKFLKMVEDADFAILPSCSEGQSGSILTLMSYGLIPVITDEVGFTNFESYGFKINDYNLADILNTIESCKSAADNEIELKRNNLLYQATLYTPQAFSEKFEELLNI